MERTHSLAFDPVFAADPPFSFDEAPTAPGAATRTRALAVGGGDSVDDALCAYLAGFAIDTHVIHGGEQIRKRLAPGRFDVVLLDLLLPDEDGLRLCLWVQQVSPGIPLIILTPGDDFSSRVMGLDLGADDCLAKPFVPRELAARIRAVVRRKSHRVWTQQADRFDHWVFDRPRRQLVLHDGITVDLSAYETRILSVFIDHPWQVLSRERLLSLSNASAREVTYRSVDLAISRLRAKMGDDAREAPMIRTIRGEGYLFHAASRG